MKPQYAAPRYAHRGFTLVELMIVVVIASILVAVAVPSYNSSIRKSRRVEAKTALLDLAAREERYLSTNPAGYTSTSTDLGYTAWGAVASGYYALQQPVLNGALGTPSFVITALPQGTQANDTQCATFSVDSTGKQSAADNGGADQTAVCWAH